MHPEQRFDKWHEKITAGKYEEAEQELKTERQQGDEFQVYGEGLFYMSVCSSLPQEEVVQRAHQLICRTTTGWALANENFRAGQLNPCPCDQKPETHRHYLFAA